MSDGAEILPNTAEAMQVPILTPPSSPAPSARPGNAPARGSGDGSFDDVFGSSAPPEDRAADAGDTALSAEARDGGASGDVPAPTPRSEDARSQAAEPVVETEAPGVEADDPLMGLVPPDESGRSARATDTNPEVAVPPTPRGRVAAAQDIAGEGPGTEPVQPHHKAAASPEAKSDAAAASARVAERATTTTAPVPAAPAAAAAPGAEVVVRRLEAKGEAVRDRIRNTAPPSQVPTPSPIAPAGATQPEAARIAALAAIESPPGATDAAALDGGPIEMMTTEGRSAADPAARAEAALRHEPPRPVPAQIADAARALRDGPVELTLRPEELGTVRMTLSTGGDGAMTLLLHAERPETLELLRRHIGDLARELGTLGFENLDLQFSDDRRPTRDDRQDPVAGSTEPAVATIELAPHPFTRGRPAMSGSGGLDLRL